MTDLHTLDDAFTELERRADAVVPAARRQTHRGFRLVPMVATMAAVVALAAGAVWLVPNDAAGTQTADAPTAGPLTPEALADKFEAVLGDTATFEVTKGMEMANGGAMITGTLTAGGVTGGFSLAIYDTTSGVTCDPPTCTVVYRPGPGGNAGPSYIQTWPEANLATYEAYNGLDDDTMLKLLVTNARIPHDPNSEELAPQPPLTTDQMLAIVSSDRW